MLKESLQIKNFGPLVDIELEEVKKLNIFIGDSGSGKSTIMKVLVLFQWLFKRLCLRSYLKNAGIQENVTEFNFKEYLEYNGILDYLKEDSEIVYKRGKYTISYRNKKLNTRIEINKEDLSLEKMSYISDKRNIIPDFLSDTIPSDKISNFYLKETFDDFKISLKDFDKIEIPAVKVSVEKKKLKYGKSTLLVKDGQETGPYEIQLEESSSGMQNIIPMYIVIQYFAKRFDMTESAKNTIKKYMFDTDIIDKYAENVPSFNLAEIRQKNIHIHIEEPEISLYPDGQIMLIQDLINVCFKKNDKKNNISLIMSTHSPYIMNYLNLVIKNKDLAFNDIAAYQVKDGYIFNLMKPNNGIVDTRSLSDPISRIYEEYNSSEGK